MPMQMSTNAGCKKLMHIGDVRGFGEAWYDPKNIANVFGMAHLSDMYRVTMDTDNENAIVVHTNPPVKFIRKDNIYVYKPDSDFGSDKPIVSSSDLLVCRYRNPSLACTRKYYLYV